MQFGKFRLSIVRECLFKLDGGAMFGVVPKTLWERADPADELNRVELACNLLVIETPERVVLVETGMGARWSEKERERYGLKTLIDHERALASIGLSNDDVDAVIISHLHFDHVGGALIEKDGRLVPAYPKAKYFAQRGEWEFAYKANARARGSYRMEDFEPLQAQGAISLIDGDTEIVPGVWCRVTGGHTVHHQVVCFESEGQHGIYFADIVPTKSHLSPPWVMGYDHFPLESCDYKSEWVLRAARENWLVVFDHEIGVPWGHVQTDGKKFQWQALPETTLNADQPPRVVAGRGSVGKSV